MEMHLPLRLGHSPWRPKKIGERGSKKKAKADADVKKKQVCKSVN